MRKIFLCLISLVIMGSVSAMAQPQLTISPAKDSLTPQIGAAPPNVTVEIGGKPVSGSIQLFNLSKTPVKLHTTVSNWELDEANNIRTIPPTPQSMDLWTIVSPVDFTIAPGKTQTIRFSIRPRTKP
ncbi:MAG: molecular chaperone, partial [Nitrospinota bacterium]|nr:molecular chaperone [Nitrospinota bacterium]